MIMATMNRWDPFQDALTLREAMSQLFEQSVVDPTSNSRGQFIPALNLSETPESYIVELAVPGIKQDDLDVTVENSILTIKGEIKQETQEKNRNYHRREWRAGAFVRTVSLPTSVNADQIHAELKDGLLWLNIPKDEAAKPRKISLSMNGNAQPAL
jgi:HSP20 family protein